jgi:hypothetical protein
VTNDANDIVLMSHSSVVWPGAKELRTQQDGFMFTISRSPLLDAARRLRSEGYPDHCMIIIRDADGVAQDACGKIGNLLA